MKSLLLSRLPALCTLATRYSLLGTIIVIMSTLTIAQQPALKVITDPQQIKSIPKADVGKLSIEKLYTTRAIGDTAWSPDGKQIVFVSNMSGRNNLWVVPAQGGWPVQLTVSEQRQAQPAWSPNGRWIAYISDYDGDEQWDIFIVSPATGEIMNLTDTRLIAEEQPTWSPDGRKLAYMVKPKTSPSFEIDVLDFLSREVHHLTANTPKELGNVSPVWSKDGKSIAYTQQHAAGKDSNIFISELATGKSINLTPHTGEHNFSAHDWSPDGTKLLITSDAENGYENVGLLDIATKKIEWLTHDKWESRAGHFLPDGSAVTWTTDADGTTDIFIHHLRAGRTERVLLPNGVNSLGGADTAFTRDGLHLLCYHNGPDSPRDAWSYSLRDSRAHQVTQSLAGGIRKEDMVHPYLVHFPSRDGKFQISALVYIPFNLAPNMKTAGIVYVHGGPASQSVNSFNRIVQYMVNQGYAVIAPNYRGSTGYGKEFQDANRFDMGGGDLQDVLASADWLVKTNTVDPKKLILMGGSYGGYLTMMGVTKAAEMWAAGVPIVPFVNWFTEVANEDPLLQQYDLANMGDPVKNKALWEDRSPINFVERIKAPLLILAGAHDPRCPGEESQQVADAVKKRGGVAELKIYEDEGHGFSKVENQIDAYKRVADFLKARVPPADCGCNLNE